MSEAVVSESEQIESARRVVAVLAAGAAELDPLVQGLTTSQLAAPSAASQWDVSQVISHLGSGAVITKAGLDAAVDGRPNPGLEANRVVWARWDAMSREERRDEYLAANAALLAAYTGLDDATLGSLRIDLGFLPAPVPVAVAAQFRLNEYALHSWDIRVAFDPAATVQAAAVPGVLGSLAGLLGFLAKPAVLGEASLHLTVTLPDIGSRHGLALSPQGAVLGDPVADPDGTVTAPSEAWVRLVTGRLAPAYTPPSVEVTGAVPLDDLRRVFPGF